MLKKLLHLLLSFPKTFYFNLVCFPFPIAIRFPVLISYRVYIKKIHRGGIVLEQKPRFGIIKIGFSNGAFEMARKMRSYVNISEEGTIVLKGTTTIPNGSIINVEGSGRLIVGKNFSSNANLKISCGKSITFGDNVLIGWNCTFIDADGHSILNEQGIQTNEPKEVFIGNKVWIAAEVSVFKGSSIPNGSVVAYGSRVSKQFSSVNCLIGGSPAKLLREKINWIQ